jgi:hypothetical protein
MQNLVLNIDDGAELFCFNCHEVTRAKCSTCDEKPTKCTKYCCLNGLFRCNYCHKMTKFVCSTCDWAYCDHTEFCCPMPRKKCKIVNSIRGKPTNESRDVVCNMCSTPMEYDALNDDCDTLHSAFDSENKDDYYYMYTWCSEECEKVGKVAYALHAPCHKKMTRSSSQEVITLVAQIVPAKKRAVEGISDSGEGSDSDDSVVDAPDVDIPACAEQCD